MKIFALFIILILSMFTHNFYYENQKSKIINDIYLKNSANLKENFNKLIKKKQGQTAALTYVLSQDKTLISALIKKDRNLLNYSNSISGIEKFGEYKNLWIQIIDSKGYSFYRSWTNNVGDYAAGARLDVVQMLKDPKPMQQISTGRFDMTFKTMLPLYSDGELIGIIELISHFNSIAEELKNNNIEPVMIVDKSYTDKFIKPFTGLFIDDYYVANLNASRVLMKKIGKNGIDKFLNIKDYILFENYLVTTSKINDLHNNPMGYFVFFNKIENIDMALLNNFKVTHYKRLLIFMLVLILVVLLLINRKYVKNLNKAVLKQTSEIEEQKKDLKSLLDIYDKNVIFSKTDLKGYITHVSQAFCKISGYSKNELIGKNHNIIRHPDMPKEAFSKLWSELKQEHTIKLEVKNRKKNGDYYWVAADFGPEYDKFNNLIGYSAIREDITSNKDIEDIQREIIFVMGSMGESRSEETGNHVKRVAEYSKLLAELYGLPQEECRMLKEASPMHDIGKIAIPDQILKKPSKLTVDEWEIMQTHVQKGYDILKKSNRPLLKVASIVALEHHEKWNGTGYPNGLKGEDIHIYGRITAVADVFDALGSDRYYKKAWRDDDIFSLFEKEKGEHFDPKLIELFFKNIDQFLTIRDQFADRYQE
jgi:PAS domain S-box-containing protein